MEKSTQSTLDVSWKTTCYAINGKAEQDDAEDTAVWDTVFLWEWTRKESTNPYPERVISHDWMNKERFSRSPTECKTRRMPRCVVSVL